MFRNFVYRSSDISYNDDAIWSPDSGAYGKFHENRNNLSAFRIAVTRRRNTDVDSIAKKSQ